MGLIGHATLAMTQQYAHLSPDYLHSEMERTDGRAVGTRRARSDERNEGVSARELNRWSRGRESDPRPIDYEARPGITE